MELLALGAYKPWWKWQQTLWRCRTLKALNQPTTLQYWANDSLADPIKLLTLFALVTEADKILQTEYMKMIQNSGEITDRGKAMLRLLKLINNMNTRKENDMEYKVQINSLDNFKAWSGGLTTLNTVRERGGVDTLTVICEDIFSGNTPTEVQINDWLWFDSDFIYQALGYDDLLEAS